MVCQKGPLQERMSALQSTACCICSVGSLQEAVLWKTAPLCCKDVYVFLITPWSGWDSIAVAHWCSHRTFRKMILLFYDMPFRSNGKWLEKVCDKCYVEADLHYVSWLFKPSACNWMLFSECSFQQYVHFHSFLLLSYIFLFSTDRQDILQFHFKEKIHPFTLNQSEVCEIIINARSWGKIKCTARPARSDSVKCIVCKTRA